MRFPAKAAVRLLQIALVLTVVLMGRTARGDDAVAPPAPTVQFGFAAAKSLDALGEFTKQLGIPIPSLPTAETIETTFDFLGKGSIAKDKPIGMAFISSPDMNPEHMLLFVLPMNAGAGSLESLQKLGFEAMPGHADTVVKQGTGMRRTDDYLIIGQNAAAVSTLDLAPMAQAVKGGDSLVKLAVDLKAVRQGMGKQYESLWGAFAQGAGGSAGKDQQELVTSTVDTIRKRVDAIDHLDLSLTSGESGLRLALSATPFKLPEVAAIKVAGMPAGVFARVDYNFAASDVVPEAKAQFIKAMGSAASEKRDPPLTDDQKKTFDTLGPRFAALLLDPAATSIGVESMGGLPIVFISQHLAKKTDASLEMRRLVGEINVVKSHKDHILELQTYTLNEDKVLRIVAKEGDKTLGCMDMVQRGDDVFIAISSAEFRFIDHMLAMPDLGAAKALFSGWVDLGRMVEAVSVMPGSPLAGMPPEPKKEIVGLLRAQKVNFGLSTDGDAATVEISISKALLQNAPKLMKIMGVGASDVTVEPKKPADPAPEK